MAEDESPSVLPSPHRFAFETLLILFSERIPDRRGYRWMRANELVRRLDEWIPKESIPDLLLFAIESGYVIKDEENRLFGAVPGLFDNDAVEEPRSDNDLSVASKSAGGCDTVAASGARNGRRPCYDRDHEWLRWNEADGLTCAKIRDKWNGLTEQQRITICDSASSTIANGPPGYAVVKTAIRTARKERGDAKK